jgi:hypothetical protein
MALQESDARRLPAHGFGRSIEKAQAALNGGLLQCPSTEGGYTMSHYAEACKTAAYFNEYLVRTTVEYWTAMSFPAVYFAKYL